MADRPNKAHTGYTWSTQNRSWLMINTTCPSSKADEDSGVAQSSSLHHLQQAIEDLLLDETALASVLKLIIEGAWTPNADGGPPTEDGEEWNSITLRSRSSSNSEWLGIEVEREVRLTNEEMEWRAGV